LLIPLTLISDQALTDHESVGRGLNILLVSWEKHSSEERWARVRSTISDYNKDEDYIGRVQEVMEILAERADRAFKPAYSSIWAV